MDRWQVFFATLATPSPIMHGLLVLFPLTVLGAALSGWRAKERGNRRLAAFAALVAAWVWLAPAPAHPLAAALVLWASGFLWVWLALAWGRHVWTRHPEPVWAQAVVIGHLMALAVAAVVAVVRAGLRALA
jgi:hypothetical protein